jgi:hypothetical protein
MITHRAAVLLTAAAVAAVAAGCGGASDPASTASSTTRTAADPQRQLEAAVRDAIRRDHAESVRSLETNEVPAHPVATAGPALAQLRQSVADRRRSGVRVHSLTQRLRILSVRLDPSYETATALIRDDQRVQPIRAGRPLGKPVELHERARLLLHRVRGDRFVVWKVEVLRG